MTQKPDDQSDSLDPHGFDAVPAVPRTLEQRLTELEHTLLGDQVAIAKWKKAFSTYVTPRGPQPPEGLLPTMQTQVSEAVGRFTNLYKDLETHRATVATLKREVERLTEVIPNVRTLSTDGDKLATRGFVDEGLQRLSRALRDEFGRGAASSAFETVLAAIDGRIDGIRADTAAMWAAMRIAVGVTVQGLGEKTRRRIRKSIPHWLDNTDQRMHAMLEEIDEAAR